MKNKDLLESQINDLKDKIAHLENQYNQILNYSIIREPRLNDLIININYYKAMLADLEQQKELLSQTTPPAEME